MDTMAWIVLAATVGLVMTCAWLFIRPPVLFCKKFNWHNYSEAVVNSKGNWQTECTVKGCNSVLVLQKQKWTEIGE
jgi:hypothetical protein